MAKKRSVQAKALEPGPRRTVLTIKGTDEWRTWLEELSRFLRTPTSTLVDHALVRYAKEMGFEREAPER
jgi:hypothetical protein